MLTTMQRQRLNHLMSEIEYRQRLARRFLITLAIVGVLSLLMVAVTSCSASSRASPFAAASVVAGGIDPGHHASEFPNLTEPEREAFNILNQ